MDNKKIFMVFAHPDDETLGTGGTIAKYASQGVGIYLVTATNGEKGSLNRSNKIENLGLVRREELIKASKVLGIKKNYFLNYQDMLLTQVPYDELKEKIKTILKEVRPQIVVTFDSHGINGHPDHIAVSRVTTDIFEELTNHNNSNSQIGKRPFLRKLYYLTIPNSWMTGFAWIINFKRRRKYMGTPDHKITTEIDIFRFSEVKKEAWQCHASQFRNFRGIKRYVGNNFFQKEYFILANSCHLNLPRSKKEKDIFEGL